jgi:hypothetical protein
VEEVTFLGFEIFYKVRLGAGPAKSNGNGASGHPNADEAMLVRTLYSPIKKIREKGEKVVLQWRPEDASLLEN